MKLKNKSSHHKNENTFRFQTFHQRLTEINIDVVRKFGKLSATPEDADTFFSEALEKWTDLNCTQHFIDFRRDIHGQVQSLAQLVHHQDEIVTALQEHLQVPGSLALEPLLDLAAQLARDLQGDFYPYFASIFGSVVKLLSSYHQNVEVLEKAFSCLAYLFKFLWRHMVRDIHQVYRLFSPLIGSSYKEYINNFAAESFSFLMRKCKDLNSLFDLMFTSLNEEANRTAGVGRLLFEMMRGVKGGFHSSLNKVLLMLLEKLGQDDLPQEKVKDTLCDMMQAMATHTDLKHAGEVWTVLLGHLEKATQQQLSSSRGRKESSEKYLQLTLEVITVWLSYKDGLLITCPAKLVKAVLELLDCDVSNGSCVDKLLRAVSTLILTTRADLEAAHRPALVQKIFKCDFPRHQLWDFVQRLFALPLFEKDVLPWLLQYCHGCSTKPAVQDVIYLLTQLTVLKAPAPQEAGSLKPVPFVLDFSPWLKGKKTKLAVQSQLMTALDVRSLQENCADTWAALVLLPHIRPLGADVVQRINKVLEKVTDIVAEPKQGEGMPAGFLSLLLSQAVYSLWLLMELDEFVVSVSVEKLLPSLRARPSDVHVLRPVDLILSQMKESSAACDQLTSDLFEKVYTCVRSNLSSCQGQVRLLTLRVLSQFDLPLPKPDVSQAGMAQSGMFQICLAAEQVPGSVHTYREKLVHLRRLEWGVVQNQLPQGDYSQVPLRYLIGAMYANFSYLWEPVMGLVASHAHGLPREAFWEIYADHLSKAAAFAEDELSKAKAGVTEESSHENEAPFPGVSVILQQEADRLSNLTDRPDHAKYRFHMWKAMQQFPEKCEPKSRLIVPLFMQFLEKEYYPADFSVAPTQDLKRKDIAMETEEEEEAEDEEEDGEKKKDDEKKTPSKKPAGPVKRRPKRAANKALVVHLQLFAKFKNPKALYMEPTLRNLYEEFLIHRDPDVQKASFECIMTYNYKYLIPYRENFERLMDDKTFKTEMVLFSVDTENSAIEMGHREGVLPVLMRVLYGKMKTKTGKDTSGKANSLVRKSLVLRFLSGLQQHELKVFIDLILHPFQHFITDNIAERVKAISQNIDIGKVIPIRKMQGALSTVDVVFKKLGGLLEQYLPLMLQVVLGITATCGQLLELRDQIHPAALNPLKNLRQLCLARITQFMKNYDDYPYSQPEVDALFTVAVWPQLRKLPFEGVYHPTPLLKLLHTWSESARYFPLLAKCHPDDPTLTPLPYICQLLVAKTVNKTVVTCILDVIENLLSREDEEEEEEDGAAVIPVSQTVTVSLEEGVSYGQALLLPHVPIILQYLSSVAEKLDSCKKKHTLPARELNILSRLSSYVSDSTQSTKLISLLLPFLSKGVIRNQDGEVDILHTVKNLVSHAESPQQFAHSLAGLFSVVTSRVARSVLCDVVLAVAARDSSLQHVADLVTKLNAWDPKRVEEPDYMVRLDTFRQTQTQLVDDTQPLDVTMALMLMHNCCHLVSTTDDMSLRDNATLTLQNLVKRMSTFTPSSDEFKVIISKALIPTIKTGLRCRVEVARHEYIGVLWSLVKAFPTHPCLDDLHALTDPDPEADFFESIRHIQMHRRARAMRKIVRHLPGHKVRTETLTSYLLPLASVYLIDESYAKSQNVLEAATEMVGAVCRCLPWSSYQQLLTYYLQLLPKHLDRQKLMVRMVVEVLDAFHFDLRNSTGVTAHGESGKNVKDTKGSQESDSATDGRSKEEEKSDKVDSSEHDPDQSQGDLELQEVVIVEELENEAGVTENVNEQRDIQVCPQGLATRIHRMIIRGILPQLHRCLTRKAKSDNQHKKAQATKYAEDEEVLRVPIALAMVKLMQALPSGSLKQNLPGVLLKVSAFLRSRAQDVRDSARDTLVKIVQSLGASYFPFILKELRASLTRGYQLHVLSFTVHTLLTTLTPGLQSGDLDYCMDQLIQVFNEELFGNVAEEKEVEGIVSKLMEARSIKSYDSYSLLAKYVSKEALTKLIVPLKQVLDTTRSHKTAVKVQEVFRKLVQGLTENTGLDLTSLMTFTFSLTNDALTSALALGKKETDRQAPPDPRLRPPSSYLLPTTPPRGGHKPKAHIKTNNYLIVEFGLQLLHQILKRGLLQQSELSHLQLLDPFVQTLSSCLSSKHVKVTSTALRCVVWILKLPLPSLKSHIQAITNSLFVLLSKYATAGAGRGDNFELVVICFKAVTALVREVKFHSINNDQLQVLLGYAEQDIHDYSRQATAFTLLKAILSRKLMVPEMHDVIKKVEELSVTSDSAHVRLQCRQVALQFLLDYPLGKKVQQHLEFYIIHLEYEHETGRESALEIIATIFASFPQTMLVEFSGMFYVPLASRLVNDNSTRCRKLAALAVKSLLEKLPGEKRDDLFSMSQLWFKQDKLLVKKLGALATGLFVEVENTKIERHLEVILPTILQHTDPLKYEEAETSSGERDLDQMLFAVLTLFSKLIQESDILRNPKWTPILNDIWAHVEEHLLYPHAWVRLVSSQLYGSLFGAWQPTELVSRVKVTKDKQPEYLQVDSMEKLWKMCGAFCEQMQAPDLQPELANQIVKNLVFLAKWIHQLPPLPEEQTSTPGVKIPTLHWLIRRVCKEARSEVATTPKDITKRTCVFKFLAAVAVDLGKKLVEFLPHMLPPVVREINNPMPPADGLLKTLGQEVCDLMKANVGVEVFTRVYAEIHRSQSERRDERKRNRTAQAVTNPEIASRKRMKKNLNKKAAKKRKMEDKRVGKKVKAKRQRAQ